MNVPSTKTEEATTPVSQTLEHRRVIRSYELERVIQWLPKEGKLLEIGAGAGWQAKTLAERGFEVVAIDIPQSNYSTIREWPIIDYDGVTIPLEDKSVDVIFSSNVLEHVKHIDSFQKEMQRVLRPGGISIHVMPSGSWRFWTSITFYFDRLRKLVSKVIGGNKQTKARDPITRSEAYTKSSGSPLEKLRKLVIPSCHGERGNFITEIYWFSRLFWVPLFKSSGWEVISIVPNGLLYSGQHVFGNLLSIPVRRFLAKFFGSSCIIYVLKKTN